MRNFFMVLTGSLFIRLPCLQIKLFNCQIALLLLESSDQVYGLGIVLSLMSDTCQVMCDSHA